MVAITAGVDDLQSASRHYRVSVYSLFVSYLTNCNRPDGFSFRPRTLESWVGHVRVFMDVINPSPLENTCIQPFNRFEGNVTELSNLYPQQSRDAMLSILSLDYGTEVYLLSCLSTHLTEPFRCVSNSNPYFVAASYKYFGTHDPVCHTYLILHK